VNARDLLADAGRLLRGERIAFAVLGWTALSLIAHAHLTVPRWVPDLLPDAAAPLAPFVWWVAELSLLWGLMPLLIAHALGMRPRTLGLGVGRLRTLLPAYAVLYVVACVGVLIAATQPAFLETYPFVSRDTGVWSWRVLLGFWLLYAAQFVCVEFLFRGFLLFPLRPRLGDAAIPVMIVPYALVHIGKPPTEAVLAIVGGAVLGWLALRAESIWGGVLMHTAMALSMDAASLTVQGAWPATW
jgi:hypothetical protein